MGKKAISLGVVLIVVLGVSRTEAKSPAPRFLP